MENHYDLIVLGGGPAGLSASIYGGRAKLKTLVINKGSIGGMVDTTREIVNYPGFIKTSGPELMKCFKQHAETFGVEFIRDEVIDVDFTKEEKSVKTKKGKQLFAKAIIIACGSEPRLLNVPGEKELRGSGVAYCATCDAEFFENETVVVVGSGDQAIEEGIFITKYARKVIVIALHDKGILDCNKVSSEKAFQNGRMDFIWNSTIVEVKGKENVEGVRIKNLKTGMISDIECQGVFFFVGMIPSTNFLKDSGIKFDNRGYIPVNDMMETNIKGVYAVGDNRVKYLRQVVSAAGDGATAAVAAERFIEEMNDFRINVLECDNKVLLFFYDAKNNDSLAFGSMLEEVNNECTNPFKISKVDMATKMSLAEKYSVENVPEVIILEKGSVIKKLNCCSDKSKLKNQLSEK